MSSMKALSDKKYTSAPFFRFTLRQNLLSLILYAIIVFLSMVIPCLMSINASGVLMGEKVSNHYVKSLVETLGIIGILVSILMGVLAGMSAISYVNSKKQVGCYHSFPVKREGLYFSETSTRGIFYIIAILFGYALTYGMIVMTMPGGVGYFTIYLRFALFAILCFAWTFSLFLLAAGLTGTAFMRLAMVAILMFLPFAIYALVVYSISFGFINLDESYYFNTERLAALFPFVRITRDIVGFCDGESFSFAELKIFVESALFYLGGLFLHKFRKSESSGTTIIWKPVFEVLRVLLIFTAGLLGILSFGSGIFGGADIINYAFGATVGLVIALMIVNSILYRSSRSMFKGLKSFALIAIVTFAYMVFVPLNAANLIGKPYSSLNTKSYEIKMNGAEITIDEWEEVKTVNAMLNEDPEASLRPIPEFIGSLTSADGDERITQYFGDYTSRYFEKFDETYIMDLNMQEKYGYIFYDTMYLNIVQHPRFGLPLATRVRVDTSSDLVKYLLKSEDYYEFMDIKTRFEGDIVESVSMTIGAEEVSLYLGNQDIGLVNVEARQDGKWMTSSYDKKMNLSREIADVIDSYQYSSEGKFNQPIVGSISISFQDEEMHYHTITLPIYANNVKLFNTCVRLMNKSCETEIFSEVGRKDEVLAQTCRSVDAVVMVDCFTGEARWMDTSEFYQISDYLAFATSSSISGVKEYRALSDARYLFFVCNQNDEGNTYAEIRFREGAMGGSAMTELFDSLK